LIGSGIAPHDYRLQPVVLNIRAVHYEGYSFTRFFGNLIKIKKGPQGYADHKKKMPRLRENFILPNPTRMVDAIIARHPALPLPGMSPKVYCTAVYRQVESKQPDAAHRWQAG
jgi:hypothetical protein